MKKKLCCILLLLIMVVTFPGNRTFASGERSDGVRANQTSKSGDTGICSYLQLDIRGIEGQPYYVTLLSSEPKAGMYRADDEYDEDCGPRDIWDKFKSYIDAEGYFFLGNYKECSSDNRYSCSYNVPKKFKVLIYLVNEDRFLCSREKYQGRSEIDGFTIDVNEEAFVASKSGDGTTPPSYAEMYIKGLKGQHYYITMLSKEAKEGYCKRNESYTEEQCGSKEIWSKLTSYSDKEGYDYIRKPEEYSGDYNLNWYTATPKEFKMLIYVPDHNCLIVSRKAYKLEEGFNMMDIQVSEKDFELREAPDSCQNTSSIKLSISGLEEEDFYYVTILHKGTKLDFGNNRPYVDNFMVQMRFDAYQEDGWYFNNREVTKNPSNYTWELNGQEPKEFKILIYLPKEDRFISSPDSYKVDSEENQYNVVVKDKSSISSVTEGKEEEQKRSSNIEINISGLEEDSYYWTILHKGAQPDENKNYPYLGNFEVQTKFDSYLEEHGDGYYIDRCVMEDRSNGHWMLDEQDSKEFKILIYLPKEDRFICSPKSYKVDADWYAYYVEVTDKSSISSITGVEGMQPKELFMVDLNISGLEGESFYVTLLHKGMNEEYGFQYGYLGDWKVQQKFDAYKAEDGYYVEKFVQQDSPRPHWLLDEQVSKEFKILIYLPKEDRFICSPTSYKISSDICTYNVEVKDKSSISNVTEKQ